MSFVPTVLSQTVICQTIIAHDTSATGSGGKRYIMDTNTPVYPYDDGNKRMCNGTPHTPTPVVPDLIHIKIQVIMNTMVDEVERVSCLSTRLHRLLCLYNLAITTNG